MKIGYARVSTEDQRAGMQREALKKQQYDRIFTDNRISGAAAQRRALRRCLKALENGDTLVVWKLDRLARSTRDLITVLDDLKARGVQLVSYRSD